MRQEVARATEMANGFLLPIVCYLSLPTYRQFCTEPDPDDLKLSTPKGKFGVSFMIRNEYVILLDTKSVFYLLYYPLGKAMKNDYTARNIKKSSPYGHQVRHSDNMTLRSDQHVLNIEGPIMSSIAAPGATGSSATSGISGPSVSKRASSNLDRDSAVYRVKEDPI